jgi:hypothetical protein
MKIADKKSSSHTRLHVKTCAACNEEFGAYRISKKSCSKTCAAVLNGKVHTKGSNRSCVECGGDFWVRPSEDRRGSVRKFCSRKCMHPNKKLGLPEGEYLSYDGYIVISTTPDGRKQIKKHRYVMEQHIGRALMPSEIVHHIDEDKLNNSINNLQICTRSEHNRIHNFLTKKT